MTPDPGPVGQARGDEVVNGVDQVVELLAGRVALAELRERDAPAGAPPVVGQEDRDPPRRQDLAGHRVAGHPAVPDVGLGPAVDVEDQRDPRAPARPRAGGSGSLAAPGRRGPCRSRPPAGRTPRSSSQGLLSVSRAGGCRRRSARKTSARMPRRLADQRGRPAVGRDRERGRRPARRSGWSRAPSRRRSTDPRTVPVPSSPTKAIAVVAGPGEVGDVARVVGQDVAQLAGRRPRPTISRPGGGVVLVGGRDHGQLLAVGAPGDLAELARVVEPDQAAGPGQGDVDLPAGEGVVDARASGPGRRRAARRPGWLAARRPSRGA